MINDRMERSGMRWKEKSDQLNGFAVCDPDERWHAILGLIKNLAFNRARNNGREKRRKVLDVASLFYELFGHLESASDMAQVELEDTFEEFLKRLSDRESRNLVALKRIDLTNETIADKLKIDVRTIQRRLETLRQVFDEMIAARGIA